MAEKSIRTVSYLTSKLLEDALDRLRRTGITDSVLFVSIFTTYKSRWKGNDEKERYYLELTKFLVLTSVDEHFVQWFRESASLGYTLRQSREALVELGYPEEAKSVESKEDELFAWCRSVRTMIESEIYGENGCGYFSWRIRGD